MHTPTPPLTSRIARALRRSLLAGLFLAAPATQAATLYFSNGSFRITKFDTTTGANLGTFNATDLNNPIGMAFDSAGSLYTASPTVGITKFTSGGVGSIFDSGGRNGLAFDSAGNLYASQNGSNTITKFSTITGVGTVFASDGLNNPRGMAFDSAGNLFVASQHNHTIMKFTPGGVGSVFASGGLIGNPVEVAFDSAGNLFVANSDSIFGSILKFTPGGVGSAFGTFYLPRSFAFDSADNLYASNLFGDVVKFTPDGVRSNFATVASSNPTALAFDPTTLEAVPEPSRALLLGGGLMGVLLRRRRRSAGPDARPL